MIRAAEAKLAAISEQIVELALLQGRLRRLVQVCAQGDSGDCVALQVAEPPPANSSVRAPAAIMGGAAR